jgi:hypothetical protein
MAKIVLILAASNKVIVLFFSPCFFFSSVPENKLVFGPESLLSLHVIVSSLLNPVLRKFLFSDSQFDIHRYHNFATNAEGEKEQYRASEREVKKYDEAERKESKN